MKIYNITFANNSYWRKRDFNKTKWVSKTEVSLEELPEFVKDVGDIILSENDAMVYNDYVE